VPLSFPNERDTYPPTGNLAEYGNGSSSALVQQQDLRVGIADWGVNDLLFSEYRTAGKLARGKGHPPLRRKC